MNREELRAIQKPLKSTYREDPDAAVVTLKADGDLDSSDVACSGDMLLQALVACAGVTLRSVAVNREIEIRGGRVVAEGDLDFRGTLGVDQEAPVGFRDIRLRFELDTDASEDDVASLLETTERYCVCSRRSPAECRWRSAAEPRKRLDGGSRIRTCVG